MNFAQPIFILNMYFWPGLFFLFACWPNFSESSVLISSPFDNFRLECAQMSGAQRISVRMVESQGQKRQDTVFAISCNPVQEVKFDYSFFV